MRKPTLLPVLALALSLASPAFSQSSREDQPAKEAEGAALLVGRWSGSAVLDSSGADGVAAEKDGSGPLPAFGAAAVAFGLRLFPVGPDSGSLGGLVDMPSLGLYGFPIADLRLGDGGISFRLKGKAPFEGRFDLEFPRDGGRPSGAEDAPEAGPPTLAGAMRLLSGEQEGRGADRVLAEGSFSLARESASTRTLAYGFDYSVATPKGNLPGSFLVPESDSGAQAPVVLIVPASQSDRDGDNYSVPGKSDCLLQLALSLRGRGVASLRVDRRGSGEAYPLVEDESEPLFDDHVGDVVAAIESLAALGRFSSITVLGYGDGALVGACALEALPGSAFLDAGGTVSGLLALCASGRNEAEAVEEVLRGAPDELKGEAADIMAALKSGAGYPNPSPYFADYFRPSVQPYLASLYARDVRASFAAAAARCSALVVAGGADLQVKLGEARLLAEAAPGAALRVIPGMSHALKGVGDDEDANYASFTDPSIPLAEGLVDLVAAFAKASPLPAEEEVPPLEDEAPPDQAEVAPGGGAAKDESAKAPAEMEAVPADAETGGSGLSPAAPQDGQGPGDGLPR